METTCQEYWSGLPFPSPGDLPNPGMENASLALQADFFFFTTEPPGKSTKEYYSFIKKEQNNAICSIMDTTREYPLSEVSQKGKDKYHTVSLLCAI